MMSVIEPGGIDTERVDEVIHAVLGPGDLVGELAAVDGRPHAADVVALTDGDGRRLSTARFRAILGADVDTALAVAALLASRIRAADEARIDSVTGDVLSRVARRLWNLSNGLVPDGSGEIRVSTSQEDLARWCGASRQPVNVALTRLRTAGLVRTGRGAVFVLDPGRQTG